jgi:epoxyqueuosine reductase QueG
MGKQSIARYEQKYTKPDPKNLPVCMNCAHFHMDIEISQGRWTGGKEVERNKSCKLGNFVVQKMATCERFTKKPSPK